MSIAANLSRRQVGSRFGALQLEVIIAGSKDSRLQRKRISAKLAEMVISPNPLYTESVWRWNHE